MGADDQATEEQVVTKPGVKKAALTPFGAHKQRELLLKEKALKTMSRQECFDRGFLTVKDLDDEELRYGRCRDANGLVPRKNGKRTELIPKERYDEMVAEHDLRMKQKLRQIADDMINVIVDTALDDTVEPKDRLDAAKYALEWTMGKPAQTVNVNVKSAPWEDLLSQVTGIAPISRAEHRAIGEAGIVEAEWDDIPQEGSHDEEVSVATTPPDTQEAAEAPGVQSPEPFSPAEPYTVKDGPTAHAVDYDIDEVRAERLRGTIEVDNERPAAVLTEGDIDIPDHPHNQFGHRKAQSGGYADQARDAAETVQRRKEAREKRNQAKKQRKINRALGADKIKDEIVGFDCDSGFIVDDGGDEE
jgi:hypothetical protein